MNTTTRTRFTASIAALLAATAGAAVAGNDCIMYTGLEFTSAGAATAADLGDRLVVSNIGSSGQDGVSIDLGESQGVRLDFFDPQPPEPSVQLEYLVMVPAIPGDPPVPGILFNMEPSALGGSGNDILIGGRGTDFAAGGTGIAHVRVIDGQALAGDAEITLKLFAEGPTPVLSFPNGALPVAIDELTFELVDEPGAPEFRAVATFASPGEVLLPGATIPVIGDSVIIELDSVDAESFSQLIATGSSDTTMTMEYEKASVKIQEAFVEGLGIAHLDPAGDHLVVSNIGSSGQDGARFNVDSFFDINNGPMSASTNREFNIGMPPTLNQTDNVDAMDYTVWRDNLGAPIQATSTHFAYDALDRLTVSQGAQCDSTLVVQFFDGLQLIDEIAVGAAASSDNFCPRVIATESSSGGAMPTPEVNWIWSNEPGSELITEIKFSGLVEMVAAGKSTPVLFDNIIVRTTDAQAAGDPHYGWIELTVEYDPAAAPGAVALTSNGLSETCPGDFDGDRVVDGSDLAAMLADWGGNSPILDLNADGVIDGADLAALLAAWGACP